MTLHEAGEKLNIPLSAVVYYSAFLPAGKPVLMRDYSDEDIRIIFCVFILRKAGIFEYDILQVCAGKKQLQDLIVRACTEGEKCGYTGIPILCSALLGAHFTLDCPDPSLYLELIRTEEANGHIFADLENDQPGGCNPIMQTLNVFIFGNLRKREERRKLIINLFSWWAAGFIHWLIQCLVEHKIASPLYIAYPFLILTGVSVLLLPTSLNMKKHPKFAQFWMRFVFICTLVLIVMVIILLIIASISPN